MLYTLTSKDLKSCQRKSYMAQVNFWNVVSMSNKDCECLVNNRK